MTTPTRPARLLLGALLALATIAGTARPATAHDGPGTFAVESDTPTGTRHDYVVRLTWDNDGHPAAQDTTVTVTAVAPDGTAQTPLPMTSVDADGRFEAGLDLAEPGRWTVRFASVEPTAKLDVPIEVTAPTTTEAPTTTASTTTTTEATDDAEAVDTESAAARSDDDGGGIGAAPVVAVVLVIAVVVGALIMRTRRRTPDQGGA